MTLYVIANPHAGSHQAQTVAEQIKKYYTTQEIAVFYTRYKDDEKYQVEQILKKFKKKDKIIIIGGDGTLSKSLYHLPQTIPFAYFPVGSGNDFARALSLPSLQETLDFIDNNKIKEVTFYEYNDGLIVNSLNLGFAAWVVNQAADSSLKKALNNLHLGKLTYIIVAILSLFKNPSTTVTIKRADGTSKKLKDYFFFSLANNTYFGGGIMIWPTATALEKSLEIIYGKGNSFYHRFKILLSIVFKRQELSNHLYHEQSENVSLEFSKDNIIEIDGEIITAENLTFTSQKPYLYL